MYLFRSCCDSKYTSEYHPSGGDSSSLGKPHGAFSGNSFAPLKKLEGELEVSFQISPQYGHSLSRRTWLSRRPEWTFCLIPESGRPPHLPLGRSRWGQVTSITAQMSLVEQNTVDAHPLHPPNSSVEERCGVEKSKPRPQFENGPRPSTLSHLTKTWTLQTCPNADADLK